MYNTRNRAPTPILGNRLRRSFTISRDLGFHIELAVQTSPSSQNLGIDCVKPLQKSVTYVPPLG